MIIQFYIDERGYPTRMEMPEEAKMNYAQRSTWNSLRNRCHEIQRLYRERARERAARQTEQMLKDSDPALYAHVYHEELRQGA